MIDWAALYLDSFRKIERVIALNRGFLLLPVEAPGPDPGRALAGWLTAQGRPATLLEPRDDQAWTDLVGALHDAEVAPGGVAVVLGGAHLPKGFYEGVWLLNQKRDVLVKKLTCPLLWCGPRDFLAQTWERAPDFWSIRAIDRKLERPPSPPVAPRLPARDKASYDVWRHGGIAEFQKQRWLNQSGNQPHTAPMILELASALLQADALDEATSALDEFFSKNQGEQEPGRNNYARALFLKAAIARRQGDLGKARSIVEKIRQKTETFSRSQVRFSLLKLRLAMLANNPEEATKEIQDMAAVGLVAGLARVEPLYPEVSLARAEFHLWLGEHEAGLAGLPRPDDAYLTHFASEGGQFSDWLLRSDIQILRARLLAALGDAQEAVAELQDARNRIANQAAALAPGQPSALLVRVACAALDIDADDAGTQRLKALARETAEQALQLALASGDSIAERRAVETLARA